MKTTNANAKPFAMKRLIVVGAALGAVAALALPASTSKAAPAASGSPDHIGGGVDLRPRLAQGSLFSGTTGAGTRPAVLFWVRNVGPQNIESVAERLRETASFADDRGGSVSAAVKVGPATMPWAAYDLTLSPAEALRADTWYTLRIERDLAIVVGGPEDRLEELRAAKQVRFFTGSAPQVRQIVRGADPRKPVQFDVVMSEPVELGSLVRDGLRVKLGKQELQGCVVWDSGCARADSTRRTNAFSFRPTAQLPGNVPTDLTLSVGANVQGEGRTVGAGAAAARLPLDLSTGQARHVVAVPAGKWSRCSDSDDVLCWRNVTPNLNAE